jgi:hypothetical protein
MARIKPLPAWLGGDVTVSGSEAGSLLQVSR